MNPSKTKKVKIINKKTMLSLEFLVQHFNFSTHGGNMPLYWLTKPPQESHLCSLSVALLDGPLSDTRPALIRSRCLSLV